MIRVQCIPHNFAHFLGLFPQLNTCLPLHQDINLTSNFLTLDHFTPLITKINSNLPILDNQLPIPRLIDRQKTGSKSSARHSTRSPQSSSIHSVSKTLRQPSQKGQHSGRTTGPRALGLPEHPQTRQEKHHHHHQYSGSI